MEKEQVIKTGGINYNGLQLLVLVTLRVLIGWHLLYEGMVKVFNPSWTSAGYLLDSKGFLSGFFYSLTYNPKILQIVDLVNEWTLVVVGAALILGIFTRIASFAGIVLMGMYFLSHPPFLGLNYAIPSEGSYLVVNKVLIEAIALAVFTVFPTGRIGLDRFLFSKWTKNY